MRVRTARFYDFGKTMEFIDQCADKALSPLAMGTQTKRNKNDDKNVGSAFGVFEKKSVGEA